MADIIVESKTPAFDGMSLTFRAACDCTEISGLAVNFPNVQEDTLVYEKKRFEFKDALGNTLTGLGNLFAKGAYVHVILDTVNNFAYIQNAATNAYIEKKAPDGYIAPSSVIDGTKYFDLAFTEEDLNNWLTNIVKSMDVGTMKMSAIVGDSLFNTTGLVQVMLYRDDGLTMDYAHCVAKFSAVVNGCVTNWQKSYDGASWSELEWENPPMNVGVEYRTAERWNGNPVYVKLVDCGALPNNSNKTVAFSEEDSCIPIEIFGGVTNSLFMIPRVGTAETVSVDATAGSLVISTSYDASAITARVGVKYVKTY